MNKMLAALTAATVGLSGAAAFADPAAIAEANERKICRDYKAVDAEYLEDGTLKVLCPAGYLGPTGAVAGAGLPTSLAGTGLTAGAAAGILAAAVFVGVVAGDDDAVSTPTPTSP
jgi:hypothetical protein